MNKHQLVFNIIKSFKSFVAVLPVVVAMLLLTSLAIKLFPAETLSDWFGQQDFFDVLIGTSLGSVAAGPPIASYLLGGELLASGVSLLAVTALIVSWATVGLVQLPAEMLLLGKRFAIYRNITCILLAIVVAFLAVSTLQLLT